MQWSPEQDKALAAVAAWLKAGEPQVFRLFGYAGTGKTTLARHVAEDASRRGRLRRLHRQGGPRHARQGLPRRHHHPQPHLPAPRRGRGRSRTSSSTTTAPPARPALIVIDECSMVDAEIGRDLLSFGVPVLVLGDPAQLPPIAGGGFFTDGRARRDADRGPPPGGRRSDHPAVDDRARGRRASTMASTARAASIGRDEVDAGGGAPRRPGPGRPQHHAAELQRPHPRNSSSARQPGAGRRRQAGLPPERPQARPPQRQPLAGRARPQAAEGAACATPSRRRTARRASAARSCRSTRPSSTAPPRRCPSRAAALRRVRLRLRPHRPQGAGLAVGRRHPLRRELRLPRARRRWLYTGITRAATRITIVR